MAGLQSSQELNTMLEKIVDDKATSTTREAAPGALTPEAPLESLRVDIDLSLADPIPKKDAKKTA